MKPIPYGRQDISAADVEAVVAVLGSDWLTQGPVIPRFESAVAELCGSQFAVAVCNATAALHLACRALGLGAGDSLWTSPNTFVASANCAIYCGADVDFVDIDPATGNMSVAKLAAKLASAKKIPRVLVPVAFGGQSCDMKGIGKLAKKYGFAVVEDASHAVGGRYDGAAVGGNQYSDFTVFSFHPVKIVTTGEGGMLTTNNPELAAKAALLRTHGITREPEAMPSPWEEGAWYYQQVDLGYNYRITDIQAALGLSQLARISEFVARRHQLADRYDALLAPLAVHPLSRSAEAYSAFHLYVVRIDPAKTRRTRREVFDFMRAHDVLVNVHYIPVHLQPYYQRRGFHPGDFPSAEEYYQRAISLPMYFALSDEQQDYVVATLTEALG